MIICALDMSMSIYNYRGRRKESFFVWRCSDRDATGASKIIALTLLLAGSSFVLLSPTPMTITTAFAQEEGTNNTTTGGATTTMTNDTATATTTSTPSSGLELSAQPIWDETVRTTSITPINETHSMATFEGNGTMTVPDTGETINMTNNGTAIGSLVPQANNTVISYGRENVFSVDDGDTSAITFFEIVQYDPTTFEGNGVVIAVFDNNATGSLASFNGMLVVGTHEEDPTTQTVTIRLWEWKAGIPIPSITTAMDPSPASPLNTATDAINSNRIEATEGEQVQEQQTTPSIASTPLLE